MRRALVIVMLLAVAVAAPVFGAGSLLYAPSGADEGAGGGLELCRVRGDGRIVGGALWFAGSLGPSPDVDAPIPHSDFTRRGYDSRWGLLYLFGKDGKRAGWIAGLGAAVVETNYVDTSNVTGWTWDGGSERNVEFQGQVGVLVDVGKGSVLRAGWDSQFGAFGGVGWKF